MSARGKPPQTGEQGFTLVEVLVALFIFALIAAASVAILGQSVAAHDRSARAQAALAELQVLRALLAADLAHVAAREERTSLGPTLPAFAGGQGALVSLVRSRLDPRSGGDGRRVLERVDWLMTEAGIVRRARNVLDPLEAGAVSAERVILSRVYSVDVRFSDGRAWRPAWVARMTASDPAPVIMSLDLGLSGAGRVVLLLPVGPAP